MRGRVLLLVLGILVVIGLIWLMPWLTLSSVDLDEPEVGTSKERAEQASTSDQPEQETAADQPEDENAVEEAELPKQEAVSDNTPPPSPPVQPSSSLPVQAPLPSLPPPSLPRVEEAPKTVLPPTDYWSYGSDYSYWDYEAGYWDYGSNYWDY